jgi:hypothetical protein
MIIPRIAWLPDPFWLTNLSTKLELDNDDDDLYAIFYYM